MTVWWSVDIQLQCSESTLPYHIAVEGRETFPHLQRVCIHTDQALYDLVSFFDMEQSLLEQYHCLSLWIEQEYIDLPLDISTKILCYLQHTQDYQWLECHDFVKLVCEDIDSISTMQLFDSKQSYLPGNQSAVVDSNGLCVHSQIYIGKNMFLSKLWSKWPLSIISYQEIQKLWPQSIIYIIS